MSTANKCFTVGEIQAEGMPSPLVVITRGIFPLAGKTPDEAAAAAIERKFGGPGVAVSGCRELMIPTNGDPIPLLVQALT